MSTTPEPTTVGDLRASQFGRRVRIEFDDTVIEGPLHEVRAWGERVEVTNVIDRERKFLPSRTHIEVTIGPWSSGQLPPSTKAWLLL